LNETLLTKPADFPGYSPGGLGGGRTAGAGSIGTKRQLSVSTRTGPFEPATPLS